MMGKAKQSESRSGSCDRARWVLAPLCGGQIPYIEWGEVLSNIAGGVWQNIVCHTGEQKAELDQSQAHGCFSILCPAT